MRGVRGGGLSEFYAGTNLIPRLRGTKQKRKNIHP